MGSDRDCIRDRGRKRGRQRGIPGFDFRNPRLARSHALREFDLGKTPLLAGFFQRIDQRELDFDQRRFLIAQPQKIRGGPDLPSN